MLLHAPNNPPRYVWNIQLFRTVRELQVNYSCTFSEQVLLALGSTHFAVITPLLFSRLAGGRLLKHPLTRRKCTTHYQVQLASSSFHYFALLRVLQRKNLSSTSVRLKMHLRVSCTLYTIYEPDWNNCFVFRLTRAALRLHPKE